MTDNTCKFCNTPIASLETNSEPFITTVNPCGCKYNTQTNELVQGKDSKPVWESIGDVRYDFTTYKLKVSGGYIYRMLDRENKTHFIFVADAPIPDYTIERNEFNALADSYILLLNQVAELSIKLNKMQSDLREFEKQRVEPLRLMVDTCIQNQGKTAGLFTHISETNGLIIGLEKRVNEISGREDEDYIKLDCRIKELEKSSMTNKHALDAMKYYGNPTLAPGRLCPHGEIFAICTQCVSMKGRE